MHRAHNSFIYSLRKLLFHYLSCACMNALCIFRRHCVSDYYFYCVFFFTFQNPIAVQSEKKKKNSKKQTNIHTHTQSEVNELNCSLIMLDWFCCFYFCCCCCCCCCCYCSFFFLKIRFYFESHLRETGNISYYFGKWCAKLKKRVL